MYDSGFVVLKWSTNSDIITYLVVELFFEENFSSYRSSRKQADKRLRELHDFNILWMVIENELFFCNCFDQSLHKTKVSGNAFKFFALKNLDPALICFRGKLYHGIHTGMSLASLRKALIILAI